MGMGQPGMGQPGMVGVCSYSPMAGHIIKLQAAQTGNCMTFEGSHLVPRPHMIGNHHQQFKLEPAQAHPGFFKLVSVHRPDHLIRFCPNIGAGMHDNLRLAPREPGSPNQAWRIEGGRLHPKGHPSMFISINHQTGRYHCDPMTQGFRIMHVR